MNAVFLSLLSLFAILSQSLRAAEIAESEHDRQYAIAKQIEVSLSGVEEIELISLDLDWYYSESERKSDSRAKLYEFPIIEIAAIKGAKITELGESVAAAIRASQTDLLPGCFNPGHALRWKKDGKDVTLIVCFHCGNGVFDDQSRKQGFLMTKAPAKLFEHTFFEAGMTKAEELERQRDAEIERQTEVMRKKYADKKKAKTEYQAKPNQTVEPTPPSRAGSS